MVVLPEIKGNMTQITKNIIKTMVHNDLNKLIPANSVEEAKKYKKYGYLVAAERDGSKVDFADFSNSPFEFTLDKISNSILKIMKLEENDYYQKYSILKKFVNKNHSIISHANYFLNLYGLNNNA